MAGSERICGWSFTLVLTIIIAPGISASADTSGPVRTWYLNANNSRLTVIIKNGARAGTFSGTAIGETGEKQRLDKITWDPATRRLEFRQNGAGFWRWYRGTIVEGILVGRFSDDTRSPDKPAELASYVFHVTGWNSTYIDRSPAPRVYELLIGNEYRARLRIDVSADSPSGYTGRFKVYLTIGGGAAGEEPEYDVEVSGFDGANLKLIRRGANWTESYVGSVSGRTISGTFTTTRGGGKTPPEGGTTNGGKTPPEGGTTNGGKSPPEG